MAGVITEDFGTAGGRFVAAEGISSDQRCQSGDSIAEWRSSEQVENGTPSTSPPYWETDDDDDYGPKPAELFGRFTWKVENFSSINKRELRSNAFEVGGYKWYILIYPQGCDVCNHLSLFLCVANHDKLLPGWSHFAQFTIAVLNKDPKKTKYSDTLHRFWKKEHDWGWKKFMELSKVYDGFVNGDALVIKAQVQVIREKAHRPFRCLDCQYRRELIRVYLSNVEQTCRRFIEEEMTKLSKFIEDKVRWPSFHSFWLGTDPVTRQIMSRDKTDAILKVVVKNFFIEKEVASTLVMDSLYSGLKALECQSKLKSGENKFPDLEKLPPPLVFVDKDMFVLADDVLLLLERAVKEPLPHQPLPPKDEKCSQNRTKDGTSGEEFSKDSIERDERRLMELGRRTVEIFVLVHIFSRIEISYQEAVALMRQEELIREEEEAGRAENELRIKRGGGGEKEKRSKKKQAKQKRSSRKGKDKGRNGNSDVVEDKLPLENPSDDSVLDGSTSKEETSVKKVDTPESASDVSDNGNTGEALQPDLDDRDISPVNWDIDNSDVLPAAEVSVSDLTNIQIEKRIQCDLDDSSSICSTDQVPPFVINGQPNKVQTTLNRGRNNKKKELQSRAASAHKVNNVVPDAVSDLGPSLDIAVSKVSQPELEAVEKSFKNEIQRIHSHFREKDDKLSSTKKELSFKDQTDAQKESKSKIREAPSSSSSVENPDTVVQLEKHTSEALVQIAVTMASSSTELSSKDTPSSGISQGGAIQSSLDSEIQHVSSTSNSEILKQNPPLKNPGYQLNGVSRPSSAPLVAAPAPKPVPLVVSNVQCVPSLSRSASAAGRLSTDPSPSAPCYVPQSYRNAIIGKSASAMNVAISNNQTATSSSYSHPSSTFMTSPTVLPPHTSITTDQTSVRSGFTFGSVKPDALNNGQSSRVGTHPEAASSSGRYSSDLLSNMERFEIYGRRKHLSSEVASKSVPYQSQGLLVDEFPHLDIINDLLDDENGGRSSKGVHYTANQQYSFPFNISPMDIASFSASGQFDQFEQHYGNNFGNSYASPSSSLRGLRNGQLSQVDLSAYANSQFDWMQNQWSHAQLTDISLPNLGNEDIARYSYPLTDYSSLVSGLNGYMYRPANGP